MRPIDGDRLMMHLTGGIHHSDRKKPMNQKQSKL